MKIGTPEIIALIIALIIVVFVFANKPRRAATSLSGMALGIIFLSRIVAVGFVALFLFSYTGSCILKGDSPPTLKEAPWVIQTESRVLYAKEYSPADRTITGVWYKNGKGKYKLIKDTQPLDARSIVQRRRE